MIKSYKDFEVYKRSYRVCISLYKLMTYLPEDERYVIVSQIKRASMSIPLNIAEGYGKRSSEAEFKRFLSMALGSGNEMLVLLDMCKDLSYIDLDKYRYYSAEYESICKMLSGLITKWK